MNRLVECVPNFSEGRNPETLQALMAAVNSVPDVYLLDHTMDPDHHRAVLTFVGPPEAVGEAALRAITTATGLIDLHQHHGAHPRVGATDVVPFVPVQSMTMDECVQLARTVGQRVGTELGIPVFLYEAAATQPARIRLEAIRQGGLHGLASRMESDPLWIPDFGPHRPHQTAGATVIGARRPLIAFNVNLRSTDVDIARTIAKSIRHSSGGWPCLKAIGVELSSRGLVQVAMNVTDYHVMPLHVAFEAVKTEAAAFEVDIASSELVGLVPQEALNEVGAAALQLGRFDSGQVLDARIRSVVTGCFDRATSLSEFRNAVASPNPTPAGASVAALVGSLAASLGVMGARLGHRPEVQQPLLLLSDRLHALVQLDVQAYERVTRARAIPKEQPERADQIEAALQHATEVPLEIAELVCQAGLLISSCLSSARPALHSDLTVAMIMAIAAVESARHTVQVNMKGLNNQLVKSGMDSRMRTNADRLEELRGLCYTPPS